MSAVIDDRSRGCCRLISPLLPYERVLSYLHRELSKCTEESEGSVQEAHMSFALRMEEPGTKQYVEDLLNLMRSNAHEYQSEMVDDAWITDFQNQVDYVPGGWQCVPESVTSSKGGVVV